jgi:hypothetical protein
MSQVYRSAYGYTVEVVGFAARVKALHPTSVFVRYRNEWGMITSYDKEIATYPAFLISYIALLFVASRIRAREAY